MKKKTLIILLLFVLSLGYGQNFDAGNHKFSVVQLKEDFTLLRKALEDAHPALYKFTTHASMDSLFNQIEKGINKDMTEAEFWVHIAPLLGKIKCGHTRISPSDDYREYFMKKAKLFPFAIKIISKKIFISKNLSSDSTIAAGTEIIAINKIQTSKILQDFYSRTSSDGYNETMRYRILEESFHIWYNLIEPETDSIRVDGIEPIANKKISFIVASIGMSERKKRNAKYKKPEDRKLILFKIIDGQRPVGILTVKTFNSEAFQKNEASFNHFIDSVFTILSDKKINKLIIDVRDNYGGDPALAGYLYSYIALKEFNLLNLAQFKVNKPISYFDKDTTDFYRFITDDKGRFLWDDKKNDWYGAYKPSKNNFKGTVYVLANGGSFSSSGFFCSLVKYYKRGKLIGEETGGSYICNDCHDNLKLPNTGLNTEIPRCTFSMNLSGFNYNERGIVPDFIIESTVADLIRGIDPILNYAINLK